MSITLLEVRPADLSPGVALGDRLITRVVEEPIFESVTLELTGRGAPITLHEDTRLILISGDGPYDKLVRDWPTDPPKQADRDYDKRMETYRKRREQEERYSVKAAMRARDRVL